jgi:hypothetical protein
MKEAANLFTFWLVARSEHGVMCFSPEDFHRDTGCSFLELPEQENFSASMMHLA